MCRAAWSSSGSIRKVPIKDFFGGDGPFIFMCAGGLRSALTTQIAQRMGLKPVYNLIGGFGAWKKAEAPIEPVEKTW
jgi:rhodanese-related sulfurtransferase